jgi:hypothetical protein
VTRIDARRVDRAAAYVAAATLLAVVVGTLREGSVGGGLALGVAVAVGVSAGLLGFELVTRDRRS